MHACSLVIPANAATRHLSRENPRSQPMPAFAAITNDKPANKSAAATLGKTKGPAHRALRPCLRCYQRLELYVIETGSAHSCVPLLHSL
ncbi:hypothetical protein [Lysobacter gummosus]|uniref:hypothetical protein n=1 Tax=Lysobacter gummosus TaxID=262324 RepID=UPI00363FF5B7